MVCLVSGRQTGKTTVLRWVWREAVAASRGAPPGRPPDRARSPEVRPCDAGGVRRDRLGVARLRRPSATSRRPPHANAGRGAPVCAREFLPEVCRRADLRQWCSSSTGRLPRRADGVVPLTGAGRSIGLKTPAPRAVALIRDAGGALRARGRRPSRSRDSARPPPSVTVETVGLFHAFTAPTRVAKLLARQPRDGAGVHAR